MEILYKWYLVLPVTVCLTVMILFCNDHKTPGPRYRLQGDAFDYFVKFPILGVGIWFLAVMLLRIIRWMFGEFHQLSYIIFFSILYMAAVVYLILTIKSVLVRFQPFGRILNATMNMFRPGWKYVAHSYNKDWREIQSRVRLGALSRLKDDNSLEKVVVGSDDGKLVQAALSQIKNKERIKKYIYMAEGESPLWLALIVYTGKQNMTTALTSLGEEKVAINVVKSYSGAGIGHGEKIGEVRLFALKMISRDKWDSFYNSKQSSSVRLEIAKTSCNPELLQSIALDDDWKQVREEAQTRYIQVQVSFLKDCEHGHTICAMAKNDPFEEVRATAASLCNDQEVLKDIFVNDEPEVRIAAMHGIKDLDYVYDQIFKKPCKASFDYIRAKINNKEKVNELLCQWFHYLDFDEMRKIDRCPCCGGSLNVSESTTTERHSYPADSFYRETETIETNVYHKAVKCDDCGKTLYDI